MTTYDERARMYPGRLLLPRGEEDERRTYVMPDPDQTGTGDAMRALWAAAFDGRAKEKITVSRDDVERVLGLASGYLDLTTYELGQEHCVKKLRDIWRARRAVRT